jgi:hypothetical protein
MTGEAKAIKSYKDTRIHKSKKKEHQCKALYHTYVSQQGITLGSHQALDSNSANDCFHFALYMNNKQ